MAGSRSSTHKTPHRCWPSTRIEPASRTRSMNKPDSASEMSPFGLVPSSTYPLAALPRAVEEGGFTLAAVRNGRFRARLDNLSQVRAYLELIAPPRPRFPPGRRATLVQLWKARPRGSKIEIAESIVVTALRRR